MERLITRAKVTVQRLAGQALAFCRRYPWVAAASVLLLIVLTVLLRASILRYQYYFGMYHDDSVYLVCAKSLVQNLDYRILSLPGQPYETKYPIGYPFLLSLILRLAPVFPSNLVCLETFQVLLSVAAILLMVSYLVATKKVTGLLGCAIGAACLLNVRFIDFAPMLMSDLPGAVAVAACFWCAEVEMRRKDIRKGFFVPWTGLLLALAITLRTQTAVLAPALFFFYLFRKRWKAMIATFAVTILIVAPQIWWQFQYNQNTPDVITFYTNYLKHAYSTAPPLDVSSKAMWANYNWSGILQINTYFPGLEQIPYQKLPPLVFQLIYKLGYFLLWLPLLIGWLVKLRRASLPALYCFFYGASLSYWPVKIEWRHILPVLVLSYYFYFVGFRFFAGAIKRKVRNRTQFATICRTATVALCAYLIVGAGWTSLAKAGWFTSLAVPPSPVTATDYQEAVAWVKENTPRQAIFVCNNDPVFYLYTQRQAIMPSRLETWRFVEDRLVDAKSMLAAIDFSHATYVMNEPVYRSMGYGYVQSAQTIEEINKARPGYLVPVFKSEHELVTVYKVNANGEVERGSRPE